MAAPLIAGLIAGAASAGIGAVGQAEARDRSEKALAEAVAYYESIGIPSVEAQKLAFQELQQQGLLTPELEQAITEGPSAFESLTEDPSLREDQRASYLALKDIADQGGMTATSEANLNRGLTRAANESKSRRDAATSRLAAQGRMGTGFQLAADLAGEQDAATLGNQTALDVNAEAQRQALEALTQAGGLAGNIRTQDYRVASDRAGATDSVNARNASAKRDTQSANVNRTNAAQEANLREKQRIADANVGFKNQEQQYNKELLQKKFQNELNLASGKAGAKTGQAANYMQGGQQQGQFWGGVADSAAKAGGSIYEYLEKNKKKEDA